MPSYNYIVNKALSRTLKKNQNYMLIVVGPTGSGKSYTGLSFAMRMDTSFDIDRICFRAKDFLKATTRDLDRGSVILFDEAGIDVSSREWYTKRNQAINQTVETFRRDNLICVWTTPVLSNIDKKARSYFHGLAEVLEPDRVGWGAVKYFDLKPNVQEGGVLKYYPSVSDEKNRPVSIEGRNPGQPNMRCPDPRKIVDSEGNLRGEKLVKKYEQKKKEFTEEVKRRGIEALEEEERTDRVFGTNDLIGYLSRRYDDYGFSSDLSDTELSRRVYARLETQLPEGVKFNKSDVRNIIGYIRDNPQEARESTNDPLKGKGKQTYVEIDKDMIPAIRKMRQDAGMSLREIADRLDIPWSKFYGKCRVWKTEGLLDY